MIPSKRTLFAAAIAAVHSFSYSSASAVVDADIATITARPTPTVEARDGVAGGSGTPILSTLHYDFTALPKQVYPFAVLRGPQFGFNQCGADTEGPASNCQTLLFNNISDFCLWGSPDPNGAIGDVEAKVVAYCTQPGHGTRVFPPGSIHGLQWIRTSGYIQVTGFIDNTALSLSPSDTGGELDPHGADLQGNPLGGVVYSNSFDVAGQTPQQVFNWNTFVGSGVFCFKACFNNQTSPDYCENRYDLVGCDYNMPSAVQNGTFTECEGEPQDIVGTYTSNGQTLTWSMPDPLNTPPPYTPRIPSSSNCRTFSSQELFAATGAPAPPPSTTGSGSASGSAPTGSGAPPANTGSGSKGTSGPSATPGSGSQSGSSPNPSQTGGAINLMVPSCLLTTLTFIAAGAMGVLL